VRNKFVPVANVTRFVEALAKLDRRGAAERQIVVVSGDAGLGKSRTALWWAVQNDAVRVHCKPQCTPAWVLSDLVRELGIAPKRTAQDLFGQATGALARDPRPLVIDEVEHTLARDIAALDTLRSLVDLVEVPLVLIGRERTAERLRGHRQIWTRIGAACEFHPLTPADVRLLADELVEGEVADDACALVHEACEGRIRDALAGLAQIEAVARKHGRATAADLAGLRLGHPWARRAGKVIGLPRREAGAPPLERGQTPASASPREETA
jgi:hypothetical protein